MLKPAHAHASQAAFEKCKLVTAQLTWVEGHWKAEGSSVLTTCCLLVPVSLTLDSMSRLFSACASFSIFSISSILPMSRPLALEREGNERALSSGLKSIRRKQRAGGRRHLDMLSGEQAELPPVEMLVSMLSELSRLRVS